MLNVQNVHSTCWLYQLRTAMYFLSENVILIPLVFPFSLTETSTENLYCWYYFALVIIWVIHVNVFHRIARFVICNYVKGGQSRFWLVIFSYFSLYQLKTMSINKIRLAFLQELGNFLLSTMLKKWISEVRNKV